MHRKWSLVLALTLVTACGGGSSGLQDDLDVVVGELPAEDAEFSDVASTDAASDSLPPGDVLADGADVVAVAPVSVVIGSEGGTVALADDSVRLIIPAGALAQPTTVMLDPTLAPERASSDIQAYVDIRLDPEPSEGLARAALLTFPAWAFADDYRIARHALIADGGEAEADLMAWYPLDHTRAIDGGAVTVALGRFSSYGVTPVEPVCRPQASDLLPPPAPAQTVYVATYVSVNEVFRPDLSVIPDGHFPSQRDTILVRSRDYMHDGLLECSLVMAHFYSPKDEESPTCEAPASYLIPPPSPDVDYVYAGYDLLINLKLVESTLPPNYRHKPAHITLIRSLSEVIDGVLRCDIVVGHVFVPKDEGIDVRIALLDVGYLQVLNANFPAGEEWQPPVLQSLGTLNPVPSVIRSGGWKYDPTRDQLHWLAESDPGTYLLARLDNVEMRMREQQADFQLQVEILTRTGPGIAEERPSGVCSPLHLDVAGDRLVTREQRSIGLMYALGRANRVFSNVSSGATPAAWIASSVYKTGLCGPPWEFVNDRGTNGDCGGASDPSDIPDLEYLMIPTGTILRFLSYHIAPGWHVLFDFDPNEPDQTVKSGVIHLPDVTLQGMHGGGPPAAFSSTSNKVYLPVMVDGVSRLMVIPNLSGIYSSYTDPYCPSDPLVQPILGSYEAHTPTYATQELPAGEIMSIDVLEHLDDLVMILLRDNDQHRLAFVRSGMISVIDVDGYVFEARFLQPAF